MRPLIVQMDLTLDGFYSPEQSWQSVSDPKAWQRRLEQDTTVGTVLLGRKNYAFFADFWPAQAHNPEASETDVQFSHWLDEVPKVVFSSTLEEATWQNSRLVKTDLAEEVSRLKQESGKPLLILHSASVAQECMRHDLVDEYWLTVFPITLGVGLPLFKQQVNFELLDSKTFGSGEVYLHYVTARKRTRQGEQ
jgi:dihydrofolate reductase